MAYWTAFALGLFGSFHCAAMCGPLAMAIPKNGSNFAAHLLEGFTYNIGRVITYSTFGLISGLIGFQINIMGYQNALSYFIGGTIVLTSLFYILKHSGIRRTFIPVPNILNQSIGKLMKSESLGSKLALGSLNGLLPCGFVYVALAASLVTESVLQSTIYMALFGLGTIPIMLTLFLAPTMLSLKLRKRMNTFIPVFSLLVGLLIIARATPLHGMLFLTHQDDNEEAMCTYPPEN